MNVLLTCAGRRNYLVQYFREALGKQGKVYAADTAAEAPSLQEADGLFVVPPVNHPDYFDVLLDLCKQNQIRLLISLNDLELPLLAKHRNIFIEAGIIPVISAPNVVDTCFDKWKTMQFFRKNGFSVPKTYVLLEDVHTALSKEEISFPLVMKPRWGTASIGIDYIDSKAELDLAYQLSKKRIMRTILAQTSSADLDRAIVVQEKLKGHEYGLDVINDLDGRYANTLIKRKLAMRAGETDRAITEESEQLLELGKNISHKLGHIGNLDCDVFVEDEQHFILEVNPRFGGGYPFSHVAGANLPAALIAWAEGAEPDPCWFRVKPNVTSAKCDRLVIKSSDIENNI